MQIVAIFALRRSKIKAPKHKTRYENTSSYIGGTTCAIHSGNRRMCQRHRRRRGCEIHRQRHVAWRFQNGPERVRQSALRQNVAGLRIGGASVSSGGRDGRACRKTTSRQSTTPRKPCCITARHWIATPSPPWNISAHSTPTTTSTYIH